MKRIIKGLPLFIVVVLTVAFAIPLNVNALTENTQYVDINNSGNLEIENIYISVLRFNDYSSTSTQAFGLSGNIYNSSSSDIGYSATVQYYDINYNMIFETSYNNSANVGSSTLNLMSNLNALVNHNIDEIKYYRLTINTSDYSVTSNDIITPSKSNQYSSKEYVIDKYDINVVVNENNTLDITENITAYFNIPKHGIFRTIPLKNTITRLDGSTSNNRTQIKNLSVDKEYTTSRENDNYKIKIGSADYTLTGEQTYLIKYTYNLGKDPMKEYDELYYNLIGTDWDTVIGNVTFTITMPKNFDPSKLGFSSGSYGSTSNDKVKYSVNGNTIKGSYNGILSEWEALTVRCELPEGYFIDAGLTVNYGTYILILIPIVFLLISIFIWYKYGKDEKVVETVEFYPPQGFNSLEVGFLYKGKADSQDVTSLLIYLANKGYIKISETEEKSLFSKMKGFRITKLKEYDGNNINEQIFLNGLFSKRTNSYLDLGRIQEIRNQAKQNGRKISFVDASSQAMQEAKNSNKNEDVSVTSIDLYDNFYITMNQIIANINSKENKNKIFEKSASRKNIFIILMIIITYCIITIPPILIYGEPELLIFALLFPGIGFTMMFFMLFAGKQTVYVNGKAINSSIGTKLFGLVWGSLFGGMPWAFMVLPALMQDSIYLIGYFIGLACVLGKTICLKYLPKRTAYGNEILGKLRGFKNFLETVEKEKLEAMVMQNPTYFYDILPYTYVLGVSDKWIKKFETISLQAPSWYDSSNSFDMASFGTFMNTTMTSAQSVMSSSPSSDSSGGGSSGGGSSGGGSGGGGGGSW